MVEHAKSGQKTSDHNFRFCTLREATSTSYIQQSQSLIRTTNAKSKIRLSEARSVSKTHLVVVLCFVHASCSQSQGGCNDNNVLKFPNTIWICYKWLLCQVIYQQYLLLHSNTLLCNRLHM